MQNYKINIFDSWDDTYCEEGLLNILKERLELNIKEESLFDKIIELFEKRDTERILIL